MSRIQKCAFLLQIRLCALVLLCAFFPAVQSADDGADLATYDSHVRPLLRKYCVRCHSGKMPKARIGLDAIDPDIISGEHSGHWEDIREAFNTGEMPPEDEAQPTVTERVAMTLWLDSEFKKAARQTAGTARGNVRRLTRYELQYALEDLLHTSVRQEISALPEEGASTETGLRNNAQQLMISSPHLESYLNVILSIISRMKDIAVFEPHSVDADIPRLNVKPAATFADKGKRNKPPIAKVDRKGKGVVVKPGGYIDLRIPSISRYVFETSVIAKSDAPAGIQVAIGFQYSDVDPRQKVEELGTLAVQSGDDLKKYSLRSWPEQLPDEMTRAIDRPFFIRITNRSKAPVYLESFTYRGNINTDLTSTLIPNDLAETEVDSHVRQSITEFLRTAFRRTPTKSEVNRYNAVYEQHAQQEIPIHALLSTYQEILCSPAFFYIGLPSDQADQVIASNRVAERLALFLWCSVPDQELLDLAHEGKLTQPKIAGQQVERMLASPKSRRLVEHFTDQWLQTSKLFNVAVDRKYYPRFKGPLKELMRQETLESLNDVIRNGASALNLLKADHVFVNQTLAGFYELKGIRGPEFRKVRLSDDSHRGGLLTQGTFLVGNSDGMNSHAILRGVWVTEILLNDPPPDPPANVPPLDESIPGFDKMTLNEKLFAHRNNAACRSCHQRIDPWGIPFENYDASGSWREKVLVIYQVKAKGQKGNRKRRTTTEKNFVDIDRKSTLADGQTIDGMEELKDYLVSHRSRDFAHGLTHRILAYALSRDLDFRDEEQVDRLTRSFMKNSYSVPTLIQEVVNSESFQRGF